MAHRVRFADGATAVYYAEEPLAAEGTGGEEGRGVNGAAALPARHVEFSIRVSKEHSPRAYVRAHETKQKRNGKALKRYEVVCARPCVMTSAGPPARPEHARRPTRRGRPQRAPRRTNAARRRPANRLGRSRKAGKLPFGYYARGGDA